MILPKILNYNQEKSSFAKTVADIFSVKEESLPELHEIYKENIKEDIAINKGFPYSEYDTMFHKLFYAHLNSREGHHMQQMFDDFVKDNISPLFDASFIYQKFPTFRIHLPNSVAVSHWHYDSDNVHLHPHWEINIQIPITDTFSSNATWVESVPGLKDYAPMEMKYGQYCIFDGNRCTHGNKANNTGYTRTSLDFRVMPISKYDPAKNNNSVGTGKKFAIGEYYKLFKK